MTPFTANTIRPCLIVAHWDATYLLSASRAFRRLGWDVYPAHTSGETRRLARMLSPDLVLLAAEFPDETGWLVCDKLRREQPEACVFIVAEQPDEMNDEFAGFVGARGVITRHEAPEAVLLELRGKPFSIAS